MRTLLVVAAAAVAAAAQAQPEPNRPAFEVASVKPSAMQDRTYGIGFFTFPGGRIRANVCTVDYLIQLAYSVQPSQISGGPRWIHEDRFDIDAVPPRSSAAAKSNPRIPKLPPNAEQRRMLQTLLEDRFHLRLRRESQDGPVYFLVTTGKTLRMRPAEDPEVYPWVGSVAGAGIARDGLRGTNATMDLLAERFSQYLDHPVINRTNLPGAFDFRYELAEQDAPADTTSDILLSLQALGLKLQPGRAPIESLIVEAVEKPSAN